MFEGKLAFNDHSSADRNRREKHERCAVIVTQMKGGPLNIQESWHMNGVFFPPSFFFFFDSYTPKTSDCFGLPAFGGPRVKRGAYAASRRTKQSWAKLEEEGGKKERKKKRMRSQSEKKHTRKAHQANSSDGSAKTRKHMLVAHAPMYTRANTTHTHTHIQIQDVGSQFCKHSPYPLLV